MSRIFYGELPAALLSFLLFEGPNCKVDLNVLVSRTCGVTALASEVLNLLPPANLVIFLDSYIARYSHSGLSHSILHIS